MEASNIKALRGQIERRISNLEQSAFDRTKICEMLGFLDGVYYSRALSSEEIEVAKLRVEDACRRARPAP